MVHGPRIVPRTVTGATVPGTSLKVVMKARKIVTRSVSAVSIKAFHVRPVNLRNQFEDE